MNSLNNTTRHNSNKILNFVKNKNSPRISINTSVNLNLNNANLRKSLIVGYSGLNTGLSVQPQQGVLQTGQSANRKSSDNKDNNNTSVSDISFSEKILCHELEYSPKVYTNDMRINMKTDIINDNMNQGNIVLNPKALNFNSFAMGKKRTRSRIFSEDVQSQGQTLIQGLGNGIRMNESVYSTFEADNEKYLRTKDDLLKKQIQLSFETNIYVKQNGPEIKIVNQDFKIINDFMLK